MTEEHIIYKKAKAKDFDRYMKLLNHKIEYNGENYYIINQDNIIITTGSTSEEIYSYIVGYLNAYNFYQKEIIQLKEALEYQINI